MITKSAQNQSNCTSELYFTFNARTAWGLIIRSLSIDKSVRVLLPAYIGYTTREGSGVFDPVANKACDYIFYRVGQKLEIDISHFENILNTEKIDVALVIHYFGFCRNDMNFIRELCDKHNVILVEDCAHAFNLGLKNQTIGNYGDFSFYSVHKYLATSAGGILKVNKNKFIIGKLDSSEKATQDVLEQYIKTDFERVLKVRRENYRSYELLLPKHGDIEVMFESLENVDIPQSYPVRIKKGKREPLYFYLMNNDIPTIALYYQLIKEINVEAFPLSYQISSEILNLPVHQDITINDIKLTCCKISNFIDENKS